MLNHAEGKQMKRPGRRLNVGGGGGFCFGLLGIGGGLKNFSKMGTLLGAGLGETTEQ